MARRKHSLSGRGPAPVVSRKGTRANARRAKARYTRHTLTRSWEDRMWEEQAKRDRADRRAEQGPRHWYGHWVPYGVSAFMGGHPARDDEKRRRRVRRRKKGR
jgi:hypothetical protein